MDDHKWLTAAQGHIPTMHHSFLCEDVRQALKKCKPPTDFQFVEAHLPSDQKPCAPKYTSADLSILPDMLAPERQASPHPARNENAVACKLSPTQPRAINKKKEPLQQQHVDSSGEMQESQFGGSSSVSGSSVGTHDLPGMVLHPGEAVPQPRKNYKENRSQRKVRPQTPDVPAFLKKFIQQKRDQQKRELRESNRDLSSSISFPLSMRRAGRSALPRPAKSCESENADGGHNHQPDWKAGREQGTPSCLPQSPFKMKSLSMPRRLRDGDDLDSSRPVALHNERESTENNGCFGPHGPRLKKKVIPSPPLASTPPRSSGSSRPLADKWANRSSRRRKNFNRDNGHEGHSPFSVTRETLVAGLAGLRKIEDGVAHSKAGGIKGKGEPQDAPCEPSLVDFRKSLCNEIKKGVQLRRVATEPVRSAGRELRGQQQMRMAGGGLSEELKKRVLTLRASLRQDSDSSDDDRCWD